MCLLKLLAAGVLMVCVVGSDGMEGIEGPSFEPLEAEWKQQDELARPIVAQQVMIPKQTQSITPEGFCQMLPRLKPRCRCVIASQPCGT